MKMVTIQMLCGTNSVQSNRKITRGINISTAFLSELESNATRSAILPGLAP
jgi:hypothetical protein